VAPDSVSDSLGEVTGGLAPPATWPSAIEPLRRRATIMAGEDFTGIDRILIFFLFFFVGGLFKTTSLSRPISQSIESAAP
jgi:hypothetical protein